MTMGVKADGSEDRRRRQADSLTEIKRKVRELESSATRVRLPKGDALWDQPEKTENRRTGTGPTQAARRKRPQNRLACVRPGQH